MGNRAGYIDVQRNPEQLWKEAWAVHMCGVNSLPYHRTGYKTCTTALINQRITQVRISGTAVTTFTTMNR